MTAGHTTTRNQKLAASPFPARASCAANDVDWVEVEIPREVWVEDASQVYKAIERFKKDDIPLLEYQVEMLSNPGASKGLAALTPERKQVIYLAAVTILSRYDASVKQAGRGNDRGVRVRVGRDRSRGHRRGCSKSHAKPLASVGRRVSAQ